ncbi:uroporphyrinogen decarboxylase family protein [Barnesiella sp. An55]|uniref:uroporphyrinogen decarboxylase family protein n=1 Tax=Barnesiella sp. An55 TaxID=1965646 RepID=UPI000B38CD61|nr:uroporphyrinogen decarboxylase family protein [Barnesiella sp. An55]OUN72047.1 methylcobamide--CoM methyltransferase [Barnesiella sp. An55]
MKLKLNHNHRLAIPIMTHPGIEIIGKTVNDAVTDGQTHADAIVALAEATPSDAATVIMDLTVEAEAFGAKLHFADNDVPSVAERLLHNMSEVENLPIPDLTAARVPQYLKANRLAAERINDRPVFAGCIGPYSLAGRLYDMTEIMMAIYVEPELAKALLEKCARFIGSYVKALKETGVDGVIMAEPAAGLLSNDDATHYSTHYIRPIVEAVQDDNFLFVLHNCGNTGHCTQSMIDSGARALHFGNKCDMVEVLKQVPHDLIAMGNLDPVGVFKSASPEQVYVETANLLSATADCDNFVISTGCDVPPGVSRENIAAFYQAVKNFNQQ